MSGASVGDCCSPPVERTSPERGRGEISGRGQHECIYTHVQHQHVYAERVYYYLLSAQEGWPCTCTCNTVACMEYLGLLAPLQCLHNSVTHAS